MPELYNKNSDMDRQTDRLQDFSDSHWNNVTERGNCNNPDIILHCCYNLIFNGNCGGGGAVWPSIGRLVLPHYITHTWWWRWTSHRWIWCGDYLSVLKATCYNLFNNLSRTMFIYSNRRLFFQWIRNGSVWMCDLSHPLCLNLSILKSVQIPWIFRQASLIIITQLRKL